MDRLTFFLGVLVLFLMTLGFYGGRLSAKQDLTDAPIERPDTLSDYQVLQLAIIITESELNPNAVGKDNDLGLMQITPIYVKEVNRILGETAFEHKDAFDTSKTLEMFSVVQDHHNPTHDIDTAIKLHNKAPWYAKRVKKNMEKVRRYESIRKLL